MGVIYNGKQSRVLIGELTNAIPMLLLSPRCYDTTPRPTFGDVPLSRFQWHRQFALDVFVPVGRCVALAMCPHPNHGTTSVGRVLAATVFGRMRPTLSIALGAEMVGSGLRGRTPAAHVRIELGRVRGPFAVQTHGLLQSPGFATKLGMVSFCMVRWKTFWAWPMVANTSTVSRVEVVRCMVTKLYQYLVQNDPKEHDVLSSGNARSRSR